MRIKLYGGPGDGCELNVDLPEIGTFAYFHELPDGTTDSVLYFRLAHHCGHETCPVWFVHPSMQGKIG